MYTDNKQFRIFAFDGRKCMVEHLFEGLIAVLAIYFVTGLALWLAAKVRLRDRSIAAYVFGKVLPEGEETRCGRRGFPR